MSNARDLAENWIRTYRLENPDWGMITGIMSNLMSKYRASAIKDAILTYYFFYPNSTIKGFANYCERLIRYNEGEKRLKDKQRNKRKRNFKKR